MTNRDVTEAWKLRLVKRYSSKERKRENFEKKSCTCTFSHLRIYAHNRNFAGGLKRCDVRGFVSSYIRFIPFPNVVSVLKIPALEQTKVQKTLNFRRLIPFVTPSWYKKKPPLHRRSRNTWCMYMYIYTANVNLFKNLNVGKKEKLLTFRPCFLKRGKCISFLSPAD